MNKNHFAITIMVCLYVGLIFLGLNINSVYHTEVVAKEDLINTEVTGYSVAGATSSIIKAIYDQIKYVYRPGETLPEDAKVVALTFDDGPGTAITEWLIEELNKRNARVTFFIVGTMAERNPQALTLAAESGHSVNIHTWDHKERYTKLSEAELQEQLQKTRDIIVENTGIEPQLVRPTYGTINQETAENIDYAIMLWNVDTRDWDTRDAEKVSQYIIENAQDGDVVILHDIFWSSVEGAIQAIDVLQEQGYVFVTVEELFAIKGVELEKGKVYRNPFTIVDL